MKVRCMKAWPGCQAMVACAAMVLLAACTSAPPQISIEGAKAELSEAVYGEAMVVMSIKNTGGADELKGVRVDIPGAKASIHIMQGMRMAHVDRVEIRGNSDLVFKMGGSHIMLEEMPKTFKTGTKFMLTLEFAKSGEKTLPLTLEGAAAMPMGKGRAM